MSFAATDYPSGALAGSGTHNVTLSGSAVPDGMLLFASLGGTETVGELFTYSIKLKTPDILNLDYVSPAANLQLKPMVGKDLCVNIELDGGGKRYISGLVTAARVAGHQGRSVVYELRLEPWLKTLTHTSDYKAFQNKNVVDILDEVLDEYPWPVEKRLVENYPTRAWQVQYGETDFDFIQRLMQEWGIYWWFEHSENSHTLVLADAINVHKACADSPLVCYYQKGLKLDKEFIHTITANESLRSGQWVLNDFDFMKPRSLLKSTVANPRETGLAEYEHYEWPGDYFTKSEGEMLTRIRMEEQRSPGSRVQGSGQAALRPRRATEAQGDIQRDARGGSGHVHGPAVQLQRRGETDYFYDTTGRITACRSEDEGYLASWEYDAAGNLLDRRAGGRATVENSVVLFNRLMSYRGVHYRYDEFGRAVEKEGRSGTQSYRYDAEHRMVEVTTARGTYRYVYDALGRRTEKQHISPDGKPYNRTKFLWDGMRLAQENRPEGISSLYIYSDPGSYEPLARLDKAGKEGPNRILYFHTDVNGAPEEMMDSNGKIVWETGYQVWGNTIQEKDHGGVEQNLRYQGQYLDRETGLHYNLHRYYDPDVGRFMVTDPIGLRGGLNLYAYAPNPLTYIDPLGLCKLRGSNGRFRSAQNIQEEIGGLPNFSGKTPRANTANFA